MMNRQLHLASQFLAMAGKSFSAAKADDSHTNVNFDSTSRSFESWPLNDQGLQLRFDVPNFSLCWTDAAKTHFELHGKSHQEALHWLERSAKDLGFETPYRFDLHYALDFEWDADFVFEKKNVDQIDALLALRVLANDALGAFLEKIKLPSDVRVWPHHFDTGAFVVLEDGSGRSVGMGMAIPDSMVDQHYFYISGYHGHEGIATEDFDPLPLGEWKNEGFKGAVLAVGNHNEEAVVSFLDVAFEALTS
ncbi:hypothetical protein ABV409_00220 [Flagellimonas sp. DF-77]|uniref:hypothetical protein n=1 Tax=Flagellimonas algarum TaxID=3230298 RepID=UPI00339B9560